MTIEVLNRSTILVSLEDRDMRRYDLCFDGGKESETDVKAGLRDLLCHVGEVCGLSTNGRSWLVEALPSQKGCLLIISVRRVKRRVYRVKRRTVCELCVFFDADAMLDYLRLIKGRGGYSVWLYEGRYILFPEPAVQKELTRYSEYGEVYAVSPAAAARVREFGSLLCQEELQRRHIGGRAVAVRDAAPGRAAG